MSMGINFVKLTQKKESPISENSALLRIIAQSIIDIQIWFFSGGRQLFMCESSQNNFFDS